MKVLFISKSNKKGSIASLVASQSESLSNFISIEHFLIEFGGLKTYIKAITHLRALLKEESFDIIHAHYGLCGFVVLLNCPKVPVLVSFMGTDLHGGKIKSIKTILIFLINKASSFWVQLLADHKIIKSERLSRHIYSKKRLSIIPNGVNLNKFKPIPRQVALNQLCIKGKGLLVLFLGNPTDPNKNFPLLREAIELINEEVKIIAPYPAIPNEIPLYLNACDLLVVTSYFEGSPNIIKEAMACNCPIVSTDTGDASWVLSGTQGCYISSYNKFDLAFNIELAAQFVKTHGRTRGRDEIIRKKLDQESIASQLLKVYCQISTTPMNRDNRSRTSYLGSPR